MASITKRGQFQFQTSVRRKGYPTQTKTFENKRDAQDWGKMVEADMRRGVFVDHSELESTTLGELLARYETNYTVNKRGKGPEMSRIRRLKAHPLALRRLSTLKNVDINNYKNERLLEASDKTVLLELGILSHVLTVANKDWSIPVKNFILEITKPDTPKGRERRLVGDEETQLLMAARASRSASLELCIVLAIETGMRRGEIATLTWEQINLEKHEIHLSMTKNGDSRVVGLSLKAEEALRAAKTDAGHGKVTSFYDSNGLGHAFARACKNAGIKDLTFHDLRHEAASRIGLKMSATVLASQFGWRTIQEGVPNFV